MCQHSVYKSKNNSNAPYFLECFFQFLKREEIIRQIRAYNSGCGVETLLPCTSLLNAAPTVTQVEIELHAIGDKINEMCK